MFIYTLPVNILRTVDSAMTYGLLRPKNLFFLNKDVPVPWLLLFSPSPFMLLEAAVITLFLQDLKNKILIKYYTV